MSERLVLASPTRSMHAVAASTIRRRASFSVPGGLPCHPWYPIAISPNVDGDGVRRARRVERGEQRCAPAKQASAYGPLPIGVPSW